MENGENHQNHGIDADDELEPDAPASGAPDLMAELGQIFSGMDGWGGIDGAGSALQKQRMEIARQQKREANIFRDTFATPTGRQCLQLMVEQTLAAPPYPAEANLPLDAITALIIAHDAQCNFVRGILTAIAQAENQGAKETGT